MAEQNRASAVGFTVTCGSEIDAHHLVSFAVDLDLGQPDLCSVTIRNENHKYSAGDGKIELGAATEVKIGTNNAVVFKGEVVALEPIYTAEAENILVVRAFNRLHRLLRGTKSRTFLNQSDQDIVSKIAGEHGLSPKCGSDTKITHEHVYQHNQTDLEFLRVRAARIGYEVWVEDRDLYFDVPKKDADSGIKLRYGDAESSVQSGEIFLKRFAPRMSSAGVVEKVTVRGWNPLKKEEIVGEATPTSSKLGSKPAHSATSPAFGSILSFEVDHPIFSVEEAKAIAEAKLADAMMGYITGDGECRGTPEIKPGVVITITVNSDKQDDRFNGKYMVIGASHQYTHAKTGAQGGYVTSIRVNRDAEGPA